MALSNKELGLYLKNLRDIKKLSTREVYDLCGVSNSYLSLVENGHRKASAIVLKKLAPIYNVDYIDLYEKAGYIDLIEDKNIKDRQNNSTVYACPVYGNISTKHTNWEEECIEGRFPIDSNLIKLDNLEECYFLRVNDESMNELVCNSAYAFIRKTNFVKNGEIAVVLINGINAMLRKFSIQGDLIILEPMSNDSSFQVQIYDKSSTVKIIGKYIGKFEIKN